MTLGMTVRYTLVTACLAVLFSGPSHGGGFDKELFESWLDMRTGGGTTDVYWYSEGFVKSFPDGETTAKMIGFDTARLLRDPDNPNKAIQLSRKIFYFFDPATGERLDRKPIAYPHQVKTYELVGDEIIYTVESNNGSSVYTLGPMQNYSARRLDGVQWFNYSVFFERGTGKFETSDFFIQPGEGLSEQERYQSTWVSYGVAPIMSNALAWRYSSFDAMPDIITDIVSEEAPMWLVPPKDLAEIEQLRARIAEATNRP
jgi:hypothetical protein